MTEVDYTNTNNNNNNNNTEPVFYDNTNDLLFIRDSVEHMNKFNHVELLRILHKYPNVTLNENKYGIHINLSEIPNNIIAELTEYIKYVKTQEKTLKHDEMTKENLKNDFFTKDNKDIS